EVVEEVLAPVDLVDLSGTIDSEFVVEPEELSEALSAPIEVSLPEVEPESISEAPAVEQALPAQTPAVLEAEQVQIV
ncbi:hypothetical protein, partial [Klebsiella aerogenes]|uniref:hypothetical protein n=1 Tax=Klebsiella aerogenes TaxID=548 RepID=UPI001CBFB408